jgi:hypothetical protein
VLSSTHNFQISAFALHIKISRLMSRCCLMLCVAEAVFLVLRIGGYLPVMALMYVDKKWTMKKI